MPSSAATCVNGRPLPASSDTASRLNSSVNVRRVLLVIRAPRSLRSLSEVPTQPGEGQSEWTPSPTSAFMIDIEARSARAGRPDAHGRPSTGELDENRIQKLAERELAARR